jgi:FAD/FMN-containing dehydrogenase
MSTQEIGGAVRKPDAEAIKILRKAVAGAVFEPDETGYAQAAATYNVLVPPRPVLVVEASAVADVQEAVRFAAAHGLAVAVLGDGHLITGPMEEAVLITLRLMAEVTVDAVSRTARVRGSIPMGQVVEAATAVGLAPLNGSIPRVGAIGYTLGGGQSPTLGRSFGYASDHVRSLEVVTSYGQVLTVTAESDPDLFFALRGGKGNFGVVTEIEFGLFPVTQIYGGGLWFAGEQLADVLPVWRDWVREIPESMTSSVAVQRLPPLPELPDPLRGAFVVHVRIAYVGTPEDAEALIAPLRAIGPTVFDTIAELPYAAAGTIHHDPPEPLPYVDLGAGLRELSDDVLDVFVEFTGPESNCPLVSVEIRSLGGALDREPEFADAVPSRGVPFQTFAFGVGGPDAAPAMRAYLRAWIDRLQPWAHEHSMVNFLSPDEGHSQDDLRRIYGAEKYERLARVKAAYDPENRFRVNHNIAPAS